MRYALATALVVLTSTAHASMIYTSSVPPDPQNYFKVQPEYLDPTGPNRVYSVLPIDQEPDGALGWTYTEVTDTDPERPTAYYIIDPIYVALADAAVFIRHDGVHHLFGVKLDLAEFIAAGDTELTWTIDASINGTGPWNALAITSVNLGSVVRTYPIGRVPEPASFSVATAIVLCFGRFFGKKITISALPPKRNPAMRPLLAAIALVACAANPSCANVSLSPPSGDWLQVRVSGDGISGPYSVAAAESPSSFTALDSSATFYLTSGFGFVLDDVGANLLTQHSLATEGAYPSMGVEAILGAVNGATQQVGYLSQLGDRSETVAATPNPEPSSAVLALLGLGALRFVRRR